MQTDLRMIGLEELSPSDAARKHGGIAPAVWTLGIAIVGLLGAAFRAGVEDGKKWEENHSDKCE